MVRRTPQIIPAFNLFRVSGMDTHRRGNTLDRKIANAKVTAGFRCAPAPYTCTQTHRHTRTRTHTHTHAHTHAHKHTHTQCVNALPLFQFQSVCMANVIPDIETVEKIAIATPNPLTTATCTRAPTICDSPDAAAPSHAPATNPVARL